MTSQAAFHIGKSLENVIRSLLYFKEFIIIFSFRILQFKNSFSETLFHNFYLLRKIILSYFIEAE